MSSFLPIRIELKEAQRTIERMIKSEIINEFDKKVRGERSAIVRDLKEFTKKVLMEQPEIMSLRNGSLRADFGIPEEIDPVPEIIDAIVNSIDTEWSFAGGKSASIAGLKVYVQPTTFANLFGLSVANHKTKKGANIPWLEWLLTAGDKILVTEYHVEHKAGTGRSGLGHMKSKNTFRVNPSFSGTVDNNFITRAFQGKDDQLGRIIKRRIAG